MGNLNINSNRELTLDERLEAVLNRQRVSENLNLTNCEFAPEKYEELFSDQVKPSKIDDFESVQLELFTKIDDFSSNQESMSQSILKVVTGVEMLCKDVDALDSKFNDTQEMLNDHTSILNVIGGVANRVSGAPVYSKLYKLILPNTNYPNQCPEVEFKEGYYQFDEPCQCPEGYQDVFQKNEEGLSFVACVNENLLCANPNYLFLNDGICYMQQSEA